MYDIYVFMNVLKFIVNIVFCLEIFYKSIGKWYKKILIWLDIVFILDWFKEVLNFFMIVLDTVIFLNIFFSLDVNW